VKHRNTRYPNIPSVIVVTPSEYCHVIWYGKTRMVWLPDGEKILKICLFVLTECTNVTDKHTHTHRRTPHDGIGRACTISRGNKYLYNNLAIANRSRKLRTRYAEGIYRHKYYTVTLKSRLSVTQDHWVRNNWIDHTRLLIPILIPMRGGACSAPKAKTASGSIGHPQFS